MSPTRPLKILTPRLETNALGDQETARLVLAMDGTILYANPATMDMMGAMTAEGENVLSLIDFTDHEDAFRQSPLLFAQDGALFAALRAGAHGVRIKQTGAVITLQFDHILAKTGMRYIIASTLENDLGFNEGVEHYLSRPPAPDEHAFDSLSEEIRLKMVQGRIVTVSESVTALFGFQKSDWIGRSLLDFVHPDDQGMMRDILQNTGFGATPHPASIECRMITNEAQVLWIGWRLRQSAREIFMIGRDLTAMKRLEQASKRREQQLLEAEAIGNMGHWSWRAGHEEMRISDGIHAIFGTARADFKPTLDNVNALLHRRDAGRILQAFQRAIIEQNDHDIDFRVIRPDGQTRYVRCRGRCEKDSQGDVIGLFGIMQDVTAIHLHENALREAKDSAERAYATKSQFLANMSHELRTPLNAIIGFSEMIQQQLLGPIGNERYLDYIKGIHESGEHLLDLVTDILDMSKIEAGKYDLDLSTFNIIKVLRLAVHMMEGRASDQNITINFHPRTDDLMITADRRAVMQIILNLLSNAVKFSHKNGTVDIDIRDFDDRIILKIKDQGIGIPANKLGLVTKPFEQAANQYTRSHEGSGLGLAITKELAELHGGTIHIESAVNVGTIVTVRLPQQTMRKDG